MKRLKVQLIFLKKEVKDEDKKIFLMDIIADELKVDIDTLYVYRLLCAQLEEYLVERGLDCDETKYSKKLLEIAKGNWTECAEESIWEENSSDLMEIVEKERNTKTKKYKKKLDH